MNLASLAAVALGAMLANNFVFSQLLGLRPFLGSSGKLSAAALMGACVTLAMGLASAACWLLNRFVLEKFGLNDLRIGAFVLVILLLLGLAELLLRRTPALRASLGVCLPQAAVNSAVLGAVLLNVRNGGGFAESLAYGIAGGLGVLLASVLMAGIRERLTFAEAPESFRGFPLALVAAGLVALAFQGFSGLQIW